MTGRRRQRRPVPPWQPMGSARRDGGHVLVCWADDLGTWNHSLVKWFSTGGDAGEWLDDMGCIIEPTGWHPLPDLPGRPRLP